MPLNFFIYVEIKSLIVIVLLLVFKAIPEELVETMDEKLSPEDRLLLNQSL